MHVLAEAHSSRRKVSTCEQIAAPVNMQVSALEGVFKDLRADVEALLLAVPTSDLEQLALQLRDRKLQAEEQVCLLLSWCPATLLLPPAFTIRAVKLSLVRQITSLGSGTIRQFPDLMA